MIRHAFACILLNIPLGQLCQYGRMCPSDCVSFGRVFSLVIFTNEVHPECAQCLFGKGCILLSFSESIDRVVCSVQPYPFGRLIILSIVLLYRTSSIAMCHKCVCVSTQSNLGQVALVCDVLSRSRCQCLHSLVSLEQCPVSLLAVFFYYS